MSMVLVNDVKQAETVVPKNWLLGWVSALGAATVIFFFYVVVSDISFANSEAHAIVTAIGDKVSWFLAGAAGSAGALAVARKK